MDRNGRLLIAGKAVRAFAFGLNSVALGLYVAERSLSSAEIGVVLGGALLGTMLLTLVIATHGDRLGRRRVLLAGGALMTLALVIPFVRADPIVLLVLALTGMVGVTSNESTGLQTVDQAALPQTVRPRDRTAAFALYGVVAAGASALGALAVGPLVALGSAVGLSGPERHAPAFAGYAAAGVAALVLASRLDARVEVSRERASSVRSGIARESRGVVVRLSLLFGLDSLASGFVVQSFLAFWFATRFALPAAEIGVLFAAGSVLAACSFPIAARLASRIGLIRTMVFTHIPASVLLIAMAVAPSAVVATVLYLARAVLASMDVPARQSYTMSVVHPADRTATAGITNLARSGSQALGPVLAGTLLVPAGLGVPLVACGVLKICYDVALFALFRDRPEDAEAGGAAAPTVPAR